MVCGRSAVATSGSFLQTPGLHAHGVPSSVILFVVPALTVILPIMHFLSTSQFMLAITINAQIGWKLSLMKN